MAGNENLDAIQLTTAREALALLTARMIGPPAVTEQALQEAGVHDHDATIRLLAGFNSLAFFLVAMLAKERGCQVEDVLAELGTHLNRMEQGL